MLRIRSCVYYTRQTKPSCNSELLFIIFSTEYKSARAVIVMCVYKSLLEESFYIVLQRELGSMIAFVIGIYCIIKNFMNEILIPFIYSNF